MKTYVCETCEQSFATSSNLRRQKNTSMKHLSLQLKHNAYLCDVCKWEFDNVDELTRHRRSCYLLPKKDLNETCRSVLHSTTLDSVKVHDAVKAAFEEINKEVLPLYQCASNDMKKDHTVKEILEYALKSNSFYMYTRTLSIMDFNGISSFCLMRL